ncbi:MAG: ferredoxin [Candidatus Dormibacteria bacterium]
MSRLRVDPTRCDAFGMCMELLPERITLDDWGYPIIDGRPLQGRLLELATEAVAACPRTALFIDDAEEALPPRGREGAPPERGRAWRGTR